MKRGYVIYLPKVKRLWKNLGASKEAVFDNVEGARKTIVRFRGDTLAGAKVMRIVDIGDTGAIWFYGRWIAND
jgi:hypothetical protein